MEKRNGFYYEFYKNGNYVSTGFETLGKNSITTGIDTVPTMAMTIPLNNLPEENLALYDIVVHMQVEGKTKYLFHGVVDKMNINYAEYSVELQLSHYVSRMRDWIMPAGYTIKKKWLSQALTQEGAALGSPNTLGDPQAYAAIPINFVFQSDAEISCSFSSANKLEALSEALKYTDDIHFRVDLTKKDTIVIGKFGYEANVMISPNPVPEEDCEGKFVDEIDKTYVTMLTEPNYNVDYTNHFNRAVVFCGDVAHDVLHLTLQPLYDIAEYKNHAEFPVDRYDKNINQQPETVWKQREGSDNWTKVNNEKIYKGDEIIEYTNNENREYYVTDVKQLKEDGGIVRCATYQFSDMHPIPELEKTNEETGEKEVYTITDADRLEITKLAWKRAVRRLRAQRPEHVYQFNCTALPLGVNDGDKVEFAYVKKIYVPKDGTDEDCEQFEEKTVVNVSKRLYMTKRTITFDDSMNEVTTITLDNELRYRDFSDDEYELTTLAEPTAAEQEQKYGNGVRGKASRLTYDTSISTKSYNRPVQ